MTPSEYMYFKVSCQSNRSHAQIRIRKKRTTTTTTTENKRPCRLINPTRLAVHYLNSITATIRAYYTTRALLQRKGGLMGSYSYYRSSVLLVLCALAALTAEGQSPDKAMGLPSHELYYDAIQWIRCDTCVQLVSNGFDTIKRIREEGPRQPKGGKGADATGGGDKAKTTKPKSNINDPLFEPPREEAVMEELETICNPFSENGWWIRYWGIAVEDNRTTARLEPLEDYMQCKGHCLTIAEACQKVYDSPSLDKLSGMLYKWKRGKGEMQSTLCKQECRDRDELKAEVEKGLDEERRIRAQSSSIGSSGGTSAQREAAQGTKRGKKAPAQSNKGNTAKKKSKLRQIVPRLSRKIAEEKHEPADDKQMDVEEMIDRMERQRDGSGKTPKMDVFSRDTITEMQAAMTHGTKEQAAMYDPHVADLSDEEFEMLQKMFKDEKGHEYPEAPDFEAAAVARGEKPGSPLGKQPESATQSKEAMESLGKLTDKKPPAADRVAAAEAAIKAQLDKLSDEEVMSLIEELERSEKGEGQQERVGGPASGKKSGGLLDALGLSSRGKRRANHNDYLAHDYEDEEREFDGDL